LDNNKKFPVPAFGYLTFSTFIICALSGLLLAFFYNPTFPNRSITFILLHNPAAALIRSIHYWSAQLFLVLSIIHVIDHLIKYRKIRLKHSIWIRTVFIIPLILFAMLTGFFLRGDSESTQAVFILESVLKSIPFLGNILSYFLIGIDKSFNIIYFQHIVTTTTLIWILSSEHSKVYFSDRKSYIFTIPMIFIASFLLIPSIHLPSEAIIKSPWYLIGLQELLYIINIPILTILLFVFLLLFIYKYPRLIRYRKLTGFSLIFLFAIYFILTFIGLFFRGDNWSWDFNTKNITSQFNYSNFINYIDIPDSLRTNIKLVNGRPESCISCHTDVKGLVVSHSPDSIGCSSCHMGNPYTFNKDEAHQGMILNAGNLSSSRKTCGSQGCHIGISERVDKSLMNTMSGVITVDKYVFGELKSLDNHHFRIQELKNSLADKHLRGLCAGCHIGKEKKNPEPIDELSRGGGCSSCQLSYSSEAENELMAWKKDRSKITKYHPSISLKVSNKACFGCHSRSGRISTNYEGWHETMIDKSVYMKFDDKSNYRLLRDGRVFEKIEKDVHHNAGLECIDCHTSYEIMGDGLKHSHKEQSVKMECIDCHFSALPKALEYSKLDYESQKIVNLRKLFKEGRKFVLQKNSMMPLVNVYLEENKNAYMRSKNGDSIYSLKKPSPECGKNIKGHNRLSCQSCHTQWAPQCISCHTEFEINQRGWDNLMDKETEGSWIETSMNFKSDAPALGIILKTDIDGKEYEEITTFVPGMIMTLDKGENQSKSFHRLYAPAFSHTITRKSRDCKSCHMTPSALGYGRGELRFRVINGKGILTFHPQFSLSIYDNLPEDAWIGFLSSRKNSTTRAFSRPFTIEEQKKILNIGVCFECHKQNDERLNNVFGKYINYKPHLSKSCILPH